MDSIIEVDSRVWEGGLMSNHRSEVKGLLKVQVVDVIHCDKRRKRKEQDC